MINSVRPISQPVSPSSAGSDVSMALTRFNTLFDPEIQISSGPLGRFFYTIQEDGRLFLNLKTGDAFLAPNHEFSEEELSDSQREALLYATNIKNRSQLDPVVRTLLGQPAIIETREQYQRLMNLTDRGFLMEFAVLRKSLSDSLRKDGII
ncbi:MAG: hypothetical protein IPJ69_02500 [Deltaproteobacteria bacterium]|nr:MAG: hypothetical protein IPJ69_02500 [Deltaproteobacteria bacterium]